MQPAVECILAEAKTGSEATSGEAETLRRITVNTRCIESGIGINIIPATPATVHGCCAAFAIFRGLTVDWARAELAAAIESGPNASRWKVERTEPSWTDSEEEIVRGDARELGGGNRVECGGESAGGVFRCAVLAVYECAKRGLRGGSERYGRGR